MSFDRDSWQAGFRAGFMAATENTASQWKKATSEKSKRSSASKPGKKRKTADYSKRYGRAFKKLAPKYKTKSGSWKKDGFKRCQKAAHKEAGK